jgi:SAM-dependent methyltransferase
VGQDLRKPGWAPALGLDRPADAAVSTTALHWLDAAQLRAMYAELATVLRPGGLLLDGDHLREDEAAVLRAAGFAEIGTLWQLGENRILCAVTPA